MSPVSCTGKKPFGIAMAVRPDRWNGPGRIHKRIVAGNRAVVIDPMNFAERDRELLCVGLLTALTDREEQMPLGIKDKTRTEVNAG